jgi:hypothetical protein
MKTRRAGCRGAHNLSTVAFLPISSGQAQDRRSTSSIFMPVSVPRQTAMLARHRAGESRHVRPSQEGSIENVPIFKVDRIVDLRSKRRVDSNRT